MLGERTEALHAHHRPMPAAVSVNDATLLMFLLRHALLGIAAGWAILGALLYFSSLGALMFASDSWFLALLLSASGFGVTFGSVAMGTALFLLPRR
jgi:hypothetical protein